MALSKDERLALIKEMMGDEEQNLYTLSALNGADLMELQAVADKITEQIAVVLTARQLSMETTNAN
jgi:hypothetical protein